MTALAERLSERLMDRRILVLGEEVAGLAVYDVMQLLPNDVATVAVGLAASMAQVLLCAGTAGKRFALPNAQVLMHEGSAGLAGAAADVAIQAAHLRDTLTQMRSIVALHTGQSLERIATDMGRHLWFDAHAAREYGFVDHVVSSLDEISPVPRARQFGLSRRPADGTAR